MECVFLPFSCDCHSLASWEDLMWHLWWGCASVLPSTSTTGTLAPVDVRLETWQQCVSHAQPDTHGGKCLDQSEQGEQTQWLIDALIHAQLLLRIHKWSMPAEVSKIISISEKICLCSLSDWQDNKCFLGIFAEIGQIRETSTPLIDNGKKTPTTKCFYDDKNVVYLPPSSCCEIGL